MIQLNPREWQVLRTGSVVQQRAHEIFLSTAIFEVLEPYDPAHIGTVGNDIDIEGSDLDIVCCASNLGELSQGLKRSFGDLPGYQDHVRTTNGQNVFVAIVPNHLSIEVYAENRPVEQQMGYRHYMAACRVLRLIGEEVHSAIRALKRTGLKTEPAFASYLGLIGDPYLAFLEVERMTDQQIMELSNRASV